VNRRLRIEESAAFHREAIAEVVSVIAAQDGATWADACRPGKWSAAEIAQHLILSYEVPLRELGGGAGLALVLPWWKRAALRWTVLPRILAGRFPKGAPAPREVRPKGAPGSPAEAAQKLRAAADLFATQLSEAHAARPVRLTHAYFGRLTAPQILKLLAVHASHHRAQFPGEKEAARRLPGPSPAVHNRASPKTKGTRE